MSVDDVGLFNVLIGEELLFLLQFENSYNLIVFYEIDDWSFCMVYNYCDEYLVCVVDNLGNLVFVEDLGYLDVKFIYNFNENFCVYVDGCNLIGEVKVYIVGLCCLFDL